MKKMVFIAGALMLIASAAMAGSDLTWNDCLASGTGAVDRAVNCTNAGSATLFAAFTVPSDIPKCATSSVKIDVQTQASTNNWWITNPIGNRWATTSADPASGACLGWWAAAPSGPIVFPPASPLILSSTRFRLSLDAVIAAGEEQDVAPGNEYNAGGLTLKNNVGTFNNAECLQGGAIGITSLILQQPGQSDFVLTTPDGTNCCTFRGAQSGEVCPGATPTKKATWGSIKALYR